MEYFLGEGAMKCETANDCADHRQGKMLEIDKHSTVDNPHAAFAMIEQFTQQCLEKRYVGAPSQAGGVRLLRTG